MGQLQEGRIGIEDPALRNGEKLDGIEHFHTLFPDTNKPYFSSSFGFRSCIETFPQTAQAISQYAFDLNRNPRDRAMGWYVYQMGIHNNRENAPQLSERQQTISIYHILNGQSLAFIEQNGLFITDNRDGTPSAACYRPAIYCTTKPQEMMDFQQKRALRNGSTDTTHCLRMDIEKPDGPVGVRYGYGFGPARAFLEEVERSIEENGTDELKALMQTIREDDGNLHKYTSTGFRMTSYEDLIRVEESMYEIGCALTGWIPQRVVVEIGDLGSGFITYNTKHITSLEHWDVDEEAVTVRLEGLVQKFGLQQQLFDMFLQSGTSSVSELVNKFKLSVGQYYVDFGEKSYLLLFTEPNEVMNYLNRVYPDMSESKKQGLLIDFNNAYLRAERVLYRQFLSTMPLCEIGGWNTPSYGSVILGNNIEKCEYTMNVNEVSFDEHGIEKAMREMPDIKISVDSSL
jgi:hypothetical protein